MAEVVRGRRSRGRARHRQALGPRALEARLTRFLMRASDHRSAHRTLGQSSSASTSAKPYGSLWELPAQAFVVPLVGLARISERATARPMLGGRCCGVNETCGARGRRGILPPAAILRSKPVVPAGAAVPINGFRAELP